MPMAVSLQGYIRDFMQTFVFFSGNVQTTTIAIAITSSICCSIVWFIVSVISVAMADGQRESTRPNPCADGHRFKHSIFASYQRAVPIHVSETNVAVSFSSEVKKVLMTRTVSFSFSPLPRGGGNCHLFW